MDIGANPSAEGAGEDEGVDDQAVKVVDIVDTFRLQVGMPPPWTSRRFKDYANIQAEFIYLFQFGFPGATSLGQEVVHCIHQEIHQIGDT